jgi:hypothetical protein
MYQGIKSYVKYNECQSDLFPGVRQGSCVSDIKTVSSAYNMTNNSKIYAIHYKTVLLAFLKERHLKS